MGLFIPCPIGQALTMCSTALSESSGEYIPQEMTSPRGWICTSEYYATQLIALTTPNMKILIRWKVTRWLASRHHAQNYATTPFTPHVHVLQESFTFSIKRLHHSKKALAMCHFSLMIKCAYSKVKAFRLSGHWLQLNMYRVSIFLIWSLSL